MKKTARLDSKDLEHLIVTIEASMKITKRSQFFLWSQGALQGFIPHETLLCVYGDIARMRLAYEMFSRGVLNSHAEREVQDLVSGLLPRLVDDWLSLGKIPRALSPDGEGQVGRRQLLADLARCGFGHVLAHGPKEIQGEFGSFFVFAGVSGTSSARNAYLLELLMPYLHMALHRMLTNEKDGATEQAPSVALLSKREIQVLHWLKNGKTNPEIGQILEISSPTVKNHVQKIMRKLKVNNRAQAVFKSATLRLVAHGDLT